MLFILTAQLNFVRLSAGAHKLVTAMYTDCLPAVFPMLGCIDHRQNRNDIHQSMVAG